MKLLVTSKGKWEVGNGDYHRQLVTLKTEDGKHGITWLDDRFKTWLSVWETIEKGDTVEGLVELKKNAKGQTVYKSEGVRKVRATEEDSCNECKTAFTNLNTHLVNNHQIKLF
jgi:hypothetical protein